MTDAQIVWTSAERKAVEALLEPLRDAIIDEINAKPNQGQDGYSQGLRDGLRCADVAARQVLPKSTDAALAALAPHLAAREAAAFKRGAEASREQVAHWADAELADCELADAIRLLPHDLPEDKQ
jgi:hypothetical protein